MGLADAMKKDAKKEKGKGWSWKGKYGFMGSNSKAYDDARKALEEVDAAGNTQVALAPDDKE